MFRKRREDSAKDCSDEVVHPPHNQVYKYLITLLRFASVYMCCNICLACFSLSPRWFVRSRTLAVEEASLDVSGLAAIVVGKFGNFSIRGNVVRNLMIMATTTTNNS